MFLLWLRIAAVLYAVASLCAVPAVLYGRTGWQRICHPMTMAAFFFHLVSVVEMLNATHRWMPVGMHEVQSLLGLIIAGAFLLIVLFYRTISFGVFALPLTFLLVLVPSLGADKYTFSSPVIRSGWLFVHIACLLAAYAALFFSMLASLLYLVQEKRLKSKKTSSLIFAWLPPLDTIERIAYSTLLVGFPTMTIGLLAGSLLAQESVGSGYFLDPKVLLSFGMWGVYVILLFIRRSNGLRGRRAAYLSSAVFIVMLVVWAANQFSSVHRYPAS